MNELITNKKIEDMIYEIRGVQVMLDSDLAKIYDCANGTKSINLAVKRHIKRFPERFMFQLTEEECKNVLIQKETMNCKHENLRFQIETSSYENEYGGRRYNPYVFTEQGVAMLATVLRSEKAVETSIKIMDAFVKMRHFINDNNIYESLNKINNKLVDHDDKLNYLFSRFDKKEQLLLKGEEFDGYLNILEILRDAKDSIIVMDNYADISFLDLIRNIKCEVILITRNSDRLSDIEITKYNKQYHNLKVIRNNESHDRFIVIDNKEIYQIGTSINSVGEKITMIIKISNEEVKEVLLNIAHKIINKKSL